MNKELNERIGCLADRIHKLENANIIYGKKIIDPSKIDGFWLESARLGRVVEKLLDHLGVTFSTNPATEASVVITKKEPEKADS
ncbi:hypothetical protein LCGC14_1956890 [marine sediment metagenome]|uniref:Uncharacterized protein n=1 Tax=marine sediment metagenome TaxID=412755 RepID=A0A0F9G418_9ZZZZ